MFAEEGEEGEAMVVGDSGLPARLVMVLVLLVLMVVVPAAEAVMVGGAVVSVVVDMDRRKPRSASF